MEWDGDWSDGADEWDNVRKELEIIKTFIKNRNY